jgi:Cu(I)/Ag(I) efflux system membrane protein CusA/SilA
LSVADIQRVLASAVGGMNVTQSVEGRERYPVNVRYPQSYRDSPESLAVLPLVTARGQHIALGDVARVYIADGPPGIKSENSRINGWVFIDIDNVDVGTYVERAMAAVGDNLELPVGYAITWSGQYEYMLRAKQKLGYVVPLTLAIIAVLLFMNFRRFAEVAMLLGTLPFALVGSLWLMHWLGFNFSIAVAVGFIALAGVAVEIGVIMLVYLNQAWDAARADGGDGRGLAIGELRAAVIRGAGLRARPVIMTAATVIVGLLPILLGSGTGSEVMSRIAAPMVGGMISAMVLSLLVLPAVYFLWRRHQLDSGS